METPLEIVRLILSHADSASRFPFGLIGKLKPVTLNIPKIQVRTEYGWRLTSINDIYYVDLKISNEKTYSIRRVFRAEDFRGEIGLRGQYTGSEYFIFFETSNGVYLNNVHILELTADPQYMKDKERTSKVCCLLSGM